MLGIATIDRQAGSDTIAVWITGREGLTAHHHNAVVIEAASDPDAMRKVRSLTRRHVVLVTDGTVLDGLPLEGKPLTVPDVGDLAAVSEKMRARILDAFADYVARNRSSSPVGPSFPQVPSLGRFQPERDDAAARAFAVANFLKAVWTAWLGTDEERRRRTVQPRTGQTPWIMPDSMNQPTVPDFPAEYLDRLHEQALV